MYSWSRHYTIFSSCLDQRFTKDEKRKDCLCVVCPFLNDFPGANFINMLMQNFYAQRSQKRKKTVKLSLEKNVDRLAVLLYFSGFSLNDVRSSLMKLTPAVTMTLSLLRMNRKGLFCACIMAQVNFINIEQMDECQSLISIYITIWGVMCQHLKPRKLELITFNSTWETALIIMPLFALMYKQSQWMLGAFRGPLALYSY